MGRTKIFTKGMGLILILALVLQVFLPIAVYAANTEIIATTKYMVKDNTILGVDANTEVKEFLSNVSANSGAECKVYKGNVEATLGMKIATGMTLKVGTDTTYQIVVKGDANGDGKLTVTDLSLFKMHITELKKLTEPYSKAIDINYDGKITMSDGTLIKMMIVALALPDGEFPNINGDISIIPETTEHVSELGITVIWPDDIDGLTKQISLDNGRTYKNYAGQVTMVKNDTVIARLVDKNNRVVKTATLTVTNIDSQGPENFDLSYVHKVSNYIDMKGTTTDNGVGVASYLFSHDNGVNWLPKAGNETGEYTLVTVPANTSVQLKMKAIDKLANETITNAKTQRTFKTGIEILKNALGDVLEINEVDATIALPDSRIFKLAITESGGYSLYPLSISSGETVDANEVNKITEKISEFEADGIKTIEEILNKLSADGIGKAVLEENLIVVEKSEVYVRYKIVEVESGKHEARFLSTIIKSNLTTSGQIEEQKILEQIEAILATKTHEDKISNILDEIVNAGLILPENINKNIGVFETETGVAHEIRLNSNGKYMINAIGMAEDIANTAVKEKILETLEIGLKSQIIDWAIQDGLTKEEDVIRQDAIYKDVNGQYKEVKINLPAGTYSTVDIEEPVGAKITYTLNPDFPLMATKVELTINATAPEGIKELYLLTQLEDEMLFKEYTGLQTSVTEKVDIVNNGRYRIVAITQDNKVNVKEILVGNIDLILPIKVSINPETPRNTVKTGIQNGVEAGPITVKLKFSSATSLTNEENKYQYSEDGINWVNAAQEQTINNITKNSIIYARYFDGVKGIKRVKINVDNIDNIAPEPFEFNTILTSHSITVKANATDRAEDSEGNPARDGIAGVGKYLYKLNDGEWQENDTFSGLTQSTGYIISAKAIDLAGNETLATNNGSTINTTEVPNAEALVTFEYSTTEFTKESVLVKFIVNGLADQSCKIQYQIITDNSEVNPAGLWEEATEVEVPTNCKIYVRIMDIKGQVAPGGKYAVGTVNNIDKEAPVRFTPEVVSTTNSSITINASKDNGGKAIDAPITNTSACSGIATYTYYLIPSSGAKKVIENIAEHTATFEGLTQGSLYGIYVEAKDNVGNIRMSEMITGRTNGKVDEYANTNTTITGTKATYDNPIIPAGFAPINENGIEWGDGTTKPAGWNDGLVIRDREGNQFVWVPVDGTNVKYEKWLTNGISHINTTNGENPSVDEKGVIDETEQIGLYGGFYVARYEASKNETKPTTVSGQIPWTSVRYEFAKEAAERMYKTSWVQSGLMTGTAWDTLMKWISNEKGESYITTSTTWGNFTGNRENTGSQENYRVKNVYDISGNVSEITNEFKGENVIVRGGAYNLSKPVAERYEYTKEYANQGLGFRPILFVIEIQEMEPTGEDVLGIGNINKGPGNITINGAEPDFFNPVVPVGFKAINTPDAKWTGMPTPFGWDNGLVIEDVNGNQFVWVPVDGNNIKYEKWYSLFAPEGIAEDELSGEEIPTALQDLNETERKQVDKYGGFYIARYEAGNEEGQLASKAGLKVVNGVTYDQAKEYAEGMYNTIYVKSGLPTGTVWDTTMNWVAKKYGTSTVNNDRSVGNNHATSFVFSGEYAVGPNKIGEYRGDYQNNTNVTKPAGQSYLLVTGIVDQFKLNNIYDLAGNVWEYSYEYSINPFGETEYIARGSDYYRPYNTSNKWGAAMRENITTPPGEERNEGGFRTVLYLTEGKAEIGKFADYNRTMDGEKANYDNPIIPAGFAAVNKGANWGNGTTIKPDYNNGLVIEDLDGNEFVWVPVDKSSVEYKKWLTRGISYKETNGDEVPEKLEEWDADEETQIHKYGGFYVARYETSMYTKEVEGKNKKIVQSKPNLETWTNMTYDEAKEAAESLETKDIIKSGLITGTQWDTIMRWIANEKGVEAVASDSTSWGYYTNSIGSQGAKAKNIFTMAGGAWEWTTEMYEARRIYRGGVKTDRGDSSPAGYRGGKEANVIDEETTFRMVLYITGDVIGIATKPVQEQVPLLATEYLSKSNEPVLAEGMTPIKWNGSTWVETTVDDNSWYNYVDAGKRGSNTSKWANAKTPDGSYFVWIPRYAYKILPDQKIDIVFLKGNTNEPAAGVKGTTLIEMGYKIHPAFTNNPNDGGWDKELSGIWVGKFESTGEGVSKPGLHSYSNTTGDGVFSTAMNATYGFNSTQKSKVDTHMLKNTEWGAVTYLAHSKYGVNGNAIASGVSDSVTGQDYETATNSSTTGNITGIYDMAGAKSELVAAYWTYIAEFDFSFEYYCKMNNWHGPVKKSNSNDDYSWGWEEKDPTWYYCRDNSYGDTLNIEWITETRLKADYEAAKNEWLRYRNIANLVHAPAKYKNRYGSFNGDAMTETAGWTGASYEPLGWGGSSYKNRPQLSRGNSKIFDIYPQCSNANYSNGYRVALITE